MSYNLPVIVGIDWDKAHKYLPTEEALRDVIAETVKTCAKQTELLDSLREKVIEEPSEENFTAYKIQAHAMKAAIRSIGSDLFDEAFALENAGANGDLDTIKFDTAEFIGDYKELAESLKIIVGDCDSESAFDKGSFNKKLNEIKRLMDEFDITALQDAYEEISNMSIPEQYKVIMGRLEKAVCDLEADDVIACCDEMLGI